MLGNDVIDFCSSSLLMNNVTVNASNSYLLFARFFPLRKRLFQKPPYEQLCRNPWKVKLFNVKSINWNN